MIDVKTPTVEFFHYNKDGNLAKQFFTGAEKFENCMLESEEPFILNSNGDRILISSDPDFKVPEECDYALLSSKKPTNKDFLGSKFNFRRWLKHPLIKAHTSTEIKESWDGNFNYIKEDLQKNIHGLRPPQLGALYAILSHLQNKGDKAIVVLPTGTGKTETMISTLIANQCNKLLISVPSDALREQLAKKFSTLGLLRKFGIVSEKALNPIVGIITTKFKTEKELVDFLNQVNVVVTTINILSGLEQNQKAIISDSISHYFIDEAHHSEASSWRNFIGLFDPHKVFLFTATPFRNDQKKLDGKFIYEFSLKQAQEQGYYKNIQFKPVREYDLISADMAIAEKAVSVLKDDRKKGLNHILLARCKTKDRAKEVFQHYIKHSELNPVLVYNGIPALKKKLASIKNLHNKIIVCVDMLGEGFDLPELKIAAIHDDRQSIPIMLQFIGRFTRTSGKMIGDATFITNLAYPPIQQELDQLYSKGSDWNVLLPKISEGATKKELDFQSFLNGFRRLQQSTIPFESIKPALSATVYKLTTDRWEPSKWREGISNLDTYEYQFNDINSNQNTLVVILGKKFNTDWGSFDTVQNFQWDLIIVHWDNRTDRNLAFVHTSLNPFKSKKLIDAIFNEQNSIIQGMDVFRVFHDVKRLKLYNFGGRKGIGQDISFQSFFGKNVEDGIKQLEQGTLKKNNAFGTGFKEGDQVTIGCSVKGKVWAYLRGNLKELIDWCQELGTVLIDKSINPNVFLKNTILPERINIRPQNTLPIAVDWNPHLYRYPEHKYSFNIGRFGKFFDLSSSELNIIDTPIDQPIRFSWNSETDRIEFELVLGSKIIDGRLESFGKINRVGTIDAIVTSGNKRENIADFFNEYPPVIFFADGSQLELNYYFKPKDPVEGFSPDRLESWNWEGVSLNKESMGIKPYIKDSIQFNFIQRIKDEFEIIYDDDGSGEIADVIGINRSEVKIDIHLFHLKYAKGGKVSNDIDNFYQVCGQAQKSLNWKYREGKELFTHLLKRVKKKEKEKECSRLIKGSVEDLELLSTAVKWNLDAKFHIYIVQPSLSKTDASEGILSLLGTTSHYLSTVGNVNLQVITS
ncbi:Superfamily II DNA or RNA helicase [Salinimicrobium catena]|uniref:Superfamily II DNA or RNA helicase n=1 Tax=Salinimicrobium catena TaxID=390640 RepID=A0A1H5MUA6_9FLAO|nr:DEAD/DEAH box helicase family protein [Salinimicrobium catena]SDL28237.1 Superfamily II DNA or RNA helicase [Salinimicrobium catena]SEE91948.1 Superfamily II DNA or RNA helicase [Salinimicrobium catena]